MEKKMNLIKRSVVLMLLLVYCVPLNSADLELSYLKSIGDERDDYTFFIPVGAVISQNKDIYVLDGKGLFLARYDWNGRFISRMGAKGKGPNDFYFPRSLHILNDTVYVLDKGNHRIAEIGLMMDSANYYPITSKNSFDSYCFALKSGEFLGNFTTLEDNRGRLGIIDRKGMLVRSFFNKFPIELEYNIKKHKKSFENYTHKLRIGVETKPVLGMDEKNENILVSFWKPDNPVVFFVYTLEGKMIKSFKYKLEDETYKISRFYIEASWEEIIDLNKYPNETHALRIDSLFIFKRHYIVFLVFEDYQKKELVNEHRICLVFNPQGKLHGSLKISDKLRIFSISKDGYVLASRSDEEIAKIYLFKLNLFP